MVAIEEPINRWMDKEEVVCIYNGVLLGHKKWDHAILTTWMDLEIITMSEIIQTEKDKYLYVESKKYTKLVNITKKEQTHR